jgi:hypothetical protein
VNWNDAERQFPGCSVVWDLDESRRHRDVVLTEIVQDVGAIPILIASCLDRRYTADFRFHDEWWWMPHRNEWDHFEHRTQAFPGDTIDISYRITIS